MAICGGVVVAAALVRFAASLGDFWFDEIWTWSITQNLSSPWAILTKIRHENNHYLNTWLIWLLGSDSPWVVYRLPAVLAGAGTVALAGIVAGKRDSVDRLIAMILVAGSYLCVHFSSEARGYAYVAFFSLLAVVVQERALARRRWTTDLLLAATLTLGLLSHLTFLYCWAPLLVWAALRTWRGDGAWPSLARAHLPPLVFFVWLYATNIRTMTPGGGEENSPAAAVLGTLSLCLGGPETGPWSRLLAVAAAAILVAGIVRLFRSDSDRWVLFAGVTIVAPALLMLAAGRVLYVRYFLVAIVFLLVLATGLLGDLWRRARAGKWICAALLAAFLLGNGIHVARLLKLGRGQYGAALQRIRAESRTLPGSIGSDHDFRNGMIFMYYRRELPSPEDLHFYTWERWPAGGPEWFIRHSLAAHYDPEASTTDPVGNRYHLVDVYRYAGLSGWHWAVYHNERDLASDRTHR